MFIFLCICVYGCRDRGVCIYICIYIHSYGLRIARGLRIAKDYLRSADCRITDCSTGRQNLKVPRLILPQRYRGHTQRYLCVNEQSLQRAAEIDLDHMLKYLEFGARRHQISQEWCEGLQGAYSQLLQETMQWKERARTTEHIRSKTQELSDKINTLQRECRCRECTLPPHVRNFLATGYY